MLRILLANFLVEILPLLVIIVGVVLVARSRRETPGKRNLGFALISVPVGALAYVIAGIVAAAIRGDGHFYSQSRLFVEVVGQGCSSTLKHLAQHRV